MERYGDSFDLWFPCNKMHGAGDVAVPGLENPKDAEGNMILTGIVQDTSMAISLEPGQGASLKCSHHAVPQKVHLFNNN